MPCVTLLSTGQCSNFIALTTLSFGAKNVFSMCKKCVKEYIRMGITIFQMLYSDLSA